MRGLRLRPRRQCRLRVGRLAAVRSTGQRQLRVAKPEALGGAAGHQRQRLQHLHRRAREDGALDVAARAVQVAAGVDDGQGARVARELGRSPLRLLGPKGGRPPARGPAKRPVSALSIPRNYEEFL